MRETISFNQGWLFRLGDDNLPESPKKDAMYLGAKTERMLRGSASANFGASRETMFENWNYVELPHDFIISQRPEQQYNNTLGYFKYDNGWYRKSFKLDDSDRGRRISLYFEGVAAHATVYLNGCLMAHNFCGYTSFEVDITDMVKFGEDNKLAVYVNTTEQHEGWWYGGGGIYRNVWLCKSNLVSVDRNGAYVHPEKCGEYWHIPVDITLRCDDAACHSVTVKAEIYDKDQLAAETTTGDVTIAAKDKVDLSLGCDIREPKLWDCDNPNLYRAVVHVYENGTEIDTYETRFGFRTIRFDADHGFFLNDKPVKINGVCCHEDYGLEGKAVSDSVKRLRLERLREMGANGYRTAHYPHSEATFNYCDELGFLVMAETRWFESTKEGLEQLEMLVKAHRNNPSVIMWSLGNEEPYHATDMGKRIFTTMREFVRKLDNTRPITTAVSNNPLAAPVNEVADIIGINYNYSQVDELHKKYPDKPIFLSESCAVGTTRGWYHDDAPKRGYINAFDHGMGARNFNSHSREEVNKFCMEREWLAGQYQWAGIEHRGETEWPRLCSQSGALDLFLQKKDAFYQNKSHWSSKPMVHILPHWNHPDRIGEPIKVWAYTNCDEVALFLNGEEVGRTKVEKYGHAEFFVNYVPGKLEAVGYIDGGHSAYDCVETSGSPVGLELELQNRMMQTVCDQTVSNCYAIDAEGRRIPDASVFVSFDVDGPAEIVGTGSDISDHTPVPTLDRRMRAGIIAVCVKLRGHGEVRLWARADGLKPGTAKLSL